MRSPRPGKPRRIASAYESTVPAQTDCGSHRRRGTILASLKRVLGAGDLVMLAIGAVIGAGIFGAIGTAAAGQVAPDGDGDPLRRRPGADPLVHPAGRRVRAGGALLRGAGGDDSAGRQRLRVFVRHARRAGGVDHRLGPDARVRRRQRRRRDLVGRLLQLAAARRRHRPAGVADDRLSHGAAQLESRRQRPARHGAAACSAFRSWSTCRRSAS